MQQSRPSSCHLDAPLPFHFLIQQRPQAELRIPLDAERSHYLCNVLRKRAQDEINCFDGHGTAFVCRIDVAHNRRSELVVQNVSTQVAPEIYKTGIALSLIKGQGLDRGLKQATELGATDICLLQTRRSNVKLDDNRRQAKMPHWQKVIEGAAEQCGRLHLPVLHPPRTPKQLLEQEPNDRIIVLDQSGTPLNSGIVGDDMWLMVGPEGGWDVSELALFAETHARLTSLATHTLRAETVAGVALGQLAYIRLSG